MALDCEFRVLRAATDGNHLAWDSIYAIEQRMAELEQLVALTRPNPDALIVALREGYAAQCKLDYARSVISERISRGHRHMETKSALWYLG